MSHDQSGARTRRRILFIVALLARSWIPKRVVGIVLQNGEGGSGGIGEYYDGGLSAVVSRVEGV